jgi:hypothetical protein
LAFIGNGAAAGVPIPVIVFVVLAVVFAVLLNRTAFGFNVYMLGTNLRAALFSGIDDVKVLMRAYWLAGVIAGIAGIISGACQLGQARVRLFVYLVDRADCDFGGHSLYRGLWHGSGRGALWCSAIQFLSTGLNMLMLELSGSSAAVFLPVNSPGVGPVVGRDGGQPTAWSGADSGRPEQYWRCVSAFHTSTVRSGSLPGKSIGSNRNEYDSPIRGLGIMGRGMAANLLKVRAWRDGLEPRGRALCAVGGSGCGGRRQRLRTLWRTLRSFCTVERLPHGGRSGLGEGRLIDAVRPGQSMLDMTTVHPNTSREESAAFAEKG